MFVIFTVAALTCLLTAMYFVISRQRGIPRLRANLDNFPKAEEALAQIAGLTGGRIEEGNEALIYQDGDLLEALKDTIRHARSTVHLESYVWTRGQAEREFTDLLSAKAREGLSVRLLIDAVGAMYASKDCLAEMQRNGVTVVHYHPISRLNLRRFNNRTHRKLLIVDGEVGFTFGHGIQDEWLGRGQDKYHWRDTGVRMRGSIVYPLQMIFARDWIEATGNPPLEPDCFKKVSPKGAVTGHVVSSSTQTEFSSVALLYMLSMASARKSILIQNPYFAPDKAILDLLKRMVRRGVTVRLMVPGRYSDSPVVQRAGQNLYTDLLRAGIDIYLYNKTFLHQKIMVIDGIWSHIGSTNFDERSLVLNAEIGVGLLDRETAAELEAAYERDLQHCRQLRLEDWKARPRRQKFVDWCAYQLHDQL